MPKASCSFAFRSSNLKSTPIASMISRPMTARAFPYKQQENRKCDSSSTAVPRQATHTRASGFNPLSDPRDSYLPVSILSRLLPLRIQVNSFLPVGSAISRYFSNFSSIFPRRYVRRLDFSSIRSLQARCSLSKIFSRTNFFHLLFFGIFSVIQISFHPREVNNSFVFSHHVVFFPW